MKAGHLITIFATQAQIDAGEVDNKPGITITVVDDDGLPTGAQHLGQTGSPVEVATSDTVSSQFQGYVSSSVFPTTGSGPDNAIAPGDSWVVSGDLTFTATSSNTINGADSGTFDASGGDELLAADNTDSVIDWTIIEKNIGYTPADAADTYTKSEVDTALDDKADISTTYTKTEVDTALAGKADAATTYTKTEVDSALSDKADSSNTGTADQILRVPGAGGTPAFGAIDLSKTAAVTGVLPVENQWPASVAISSATVLTAHIGTILCNVSGGNFNLTLPAPTDKMFIRVKKVGGGTNKVVVLPASGTIDGTDHKDVGGNYGTSTFTSDGTNYYTI